MLFRKEALDYQKNTNIGDVFLKHPRAYKILAFCLFLIFVGMLLFITFGKINKKAKVHGYLEPSSGIMRYTAPLQGQIQQILVEEQQWVEKGTPLLEIVNEHALNHDNELHHGRLLELNTRLGSIDALLSLSDQEFHEKQHQLQAESNAITEQLSRLYNTKKVVEKQFTIAKRKLNNMSELLSKNLVARSDVEQQESQVLDVQGNINRLLLTESELTARKQSLDMQAANLPTEYQQRHQQLKAERSRLNHEKIEFESLQRYWLVATQSGTVTRVHHKLGEQINAHEPLVHLLPKESQLEAVLLVPSESIGFIRVGQMAKVKLDAFPYQRFGFQQSTITKVSNHVLLPQDLNALVATESPVYRVTAELSEARPRLHGKDVVLKPGMIFSADIILDRQPIWYWLFEPLLSIKK
ncbi:HlyD family secretion protein [Vibrio pectenicida]|uniref:HlyD family secretion protein n=1 Tax=Vibrio pectenicida TaxID=62763 RepID=UPI0030817856